MKKYLQSDKNSLESGSEPDIITVVSDGSCLQIMINNKYNKISCVIADTELATGEKRMKLFINPNGLIPLTKEEIGRLNSQ